MAKLPEDSQKTGIAVWMKLKLSLKLGSKTGQKSKNGKKINKN